MANRSNRYQHNRDANHEIIKCAFQTFGWSVVETSHCKGLLDLIVYKDNGRFWFVEIKTSEKYKLTGSEETFINNNKLRSVVIWSITQVQKLTYQNYGSLQ